MCGEAGTETFSYGPLADHVFGNWTAVEGGTTHKGTCTVEGCQEPTEEAHSFSDKLTAGDETHWYACKCGEKKDEVKHVFDEKKFEKDEKNHWHVCACGAKSEAEAHTWDEGKVTVETSTKHEGEKTFTCTACAATCVEKIPQLETPKNGDSTMVMPLVILAVLSALGAAATLLLKKRQAC